MLQIKNTLGGGKPEGLYVWKKCENDAGHTFIDYIVSDKETAYPDGGEKGGYWYERVSEGITPEMFGCTKMAVDTFTLSSTMEIKNYTISHSLGEIPKFMYVVAERLPTSYDGAIYNYVNTNINLDSITLYGKITYYSINASNVNHIVETNANANSITANSFYINGSYNYYEANVKYTVITMA